MASLTSCMKKAGKALPEADRAAILARFNALTEAGTKAAEAARQAVDEQIAAAREAVAALAPAQPAPASEATPPAPAPVRGYGDLETIAGRLGISVFKAGGGWHAGGNAVDVPAADVDVVMTGAVSPSHVFAHELGHAIMQKRGVSFAGFPRSEVVKSVPNWDAMIAVSKAFRPGVHAHENDRFRKHALKPNEVMADAIGAVLLGTQDIALIRPLMQAVGLNEVDLGLMTVEEYNAKSKAPAPSQAAPSAAEPSTESTLTFPATAAGAVQAFNADDAEQAKAIIAKLRTKDALREVGEGTGFRMQINEGVEVFKKRIGEVADRLTKTAREQSARERVLYDKLMDRAIDYDRAADHAERAKANGVAEDSTAYDSFYKPMGGGETEMVRIHVLLDRLAADVRSLKDDPDYEKVSAMVREKRPRIFEAADKPTLKQRADSMRRDAEGESGPALENIDPTASRPNATLQALSEVDELFALPRLTGKTVSEIAFDLDSTITVVPLTDMPGRSRWRVTLPNGQYGDISIRKASEGRIYGFDIVDGEQANVVTERPGDNPEDVDQATEDVWIDVSRMKTGSGGDRIYAIAGALAHNTGRIFIGDPQGVSDIAMRRRPEQMLSLALRYGTTRFLAPHPDQIKGNRALGVPPLKWVYGDDEGNVQRLVALNVKAMENAVPALAEWSFDADTGQYRKGDGRRNLAGFLGAVAKARREGTGEGGSALQGAAAAGRTAARALVLKALSRPQGGGTESRGQGRDGLLDRLGAAASGPARAGLTGLFDLSRVAQRVAQMGYKPERAPTVQATKRIRSISERLDSGKLTESQAATAIRVLAGEMDRAASIKEANAVMAEKVRGADEARIKLLQARKRGDIADKAVDFALWAIDQNPALMDSMGLSVKTPPRPGLSGDYNPAAETVRLFKGSDNTETAVHEFMHHAERMMTPDMQAAIRKEWADSLAKALKQATPEQREALMQIGGALSGDKAAHLALVKAIQEGPLNYDQHYQLVNPSEFWAVNATRLLARRFDAKDSVWQRIAAWLSEALSKLKGLLGMRSDAPIIKAIEQVLQSDGSRQSKSMLANGDAVRAAGDVLQNVDTDTDAFRRWFGDSKVVDAEGKPLVVYHGTSADFTDFDRKKAASGLYGTGFYFTDSRAMADEYAGDGKTMQVYLALKNPAPQDIANEVVDRIGEDDMDGIRAELERLGYDGVMMRSAGELLAVAFRPEQIKSATGNSGTFDPTSPSILEDINRTKADKAAKENRALLAKALSAGTNSLRNVRLPAGHLLGDFMGRNAGRLNVWQRTVGTPYNLAMREPQFKPVYDAIQSFLHDVSHYAAESANLAPTILPKLERLRDIARGPVKADDAKATAAPIFEGTLGWARDGQGNAVRIDELEAQAEKMSTDDKATYLLQNRLLDPRVLKMWQGLPLEQYEQAINTRYQNEALRPGVVWSDAELRSIFSLTDPQITLYREFRAATDKSLDDMAISGMLRTAGEDVADLRDALLEAGDLNDTAEQIRDRYLELAKAAEDKAERERLTDAANNIIDIADRIQDLKDRGYAPLMRFGSLTLDVVQPDGERVYFGMFDSKAARNKKVREMRANFPEAKIEQDAISEEEFKQFAGVTPETLELFADVLGIKDEQGKDSLFQEYLRKAKANRSGLKRLIHRKGIPGFSEDIGRVLASFVYSNARQTSSNLHAGTAEKAIEDITKKQTKDYASRLNQYVKNPQEEAQALRSLMFAQFLGGSVASAMVNMTQPFMVTFPYLAQYGGTAKASAQMAKAMKDVGRRIFPADPGLTKALRLAEEDGIVSPQEVFHLQAQASGKGQLQTGDGTALGYAGAAVNNTMSRLALAWGKPFSWAEQFNRRMTFIAAYRTAVDQGMPDAATFAREAVEATQFTYNKGNRPQWARGAAGALLFTFKTYSVSMIELLSRSLKTPEGRRTALVMLAMIALVAGVDGLPFMEDIEDVIDGFAQRVLDKNWSTRMERNRLIAEGLMNALGDRAGMKVADFIAKGLSGLPGAPIDVSGRLGLHNLIPGTGVFLKKPAYDKDVADIGGPAASLTARLFEAGGQLLAGDPLKAAVTASPLAIQNVAKAAEMASTGFYPDTKGNMVVRTTLGDAAAKATGFQPNTVARTQRIVFEQQRLVGLARMTETEIVDAWAKAIVKKDAQAEYDAKQRLATWNARNPETPIKITPQQVLTRVRNMTTEKTDRVLKAAPRELRPGLADAFSREKETQE